MGLQDKWLRRKSLDDLVVRGTGQAVPGGAVAEFRSGDYLFHEGDPSREMYLILSGRVLIFQQREQGNVILAELRSPEFVGEMGCLQGEPRSANAMALEDCRVLVIDEVETDRAITALPRWFVRLIDSLVDRLRETGRRLPGSGE